MLFILFSIHPLKWHNVLTILTLSLLISSWVASCFFFSGSSVFSFSYVLDFLHKKGARMENAPGAIRKHSCILSTYPLIASHPIRTFSCASTDNSRSAAFELRGICKNLTPTLAPKPRGSIRLCSAWDHPSKRKKEEYKDQVLVRQGNRFYFLSKWLPKSKQKLFFLSQVLLLSIQSSMFHNDVI